MTEDVGLDGRTAPATLNGVPWAKWVAITGRLSTLYGRQLMRPDYGLDMTDEVGRNQTNIDFVEIRRRVKRSIAPLRPALVAVERSPDDRIDIRITV